MFYFIGLFMEKKVFIYDTGFFDRVYLSELDLKSLTYMVNSLAKLKLNLDGIETSYLENYLYSIIFSLISNPIDENTVRWFWSHGFYTDKKQNLFMK